METSRLGRIEVVVASGQVNERIDDGKPSEWSVMSEEKMREHLVNALKARALFYYAFYKEFSAEIGPERTKEIMKRAIYKRGVEIGKQFAKFAPSDMAGLKDRLPGLHPRPQALSIPSLKAAPRRASTSS